MVQGVTKTAASDTSGNYSFSIPNGWSGSLTPSHACYTFNPASRSYTNITANQTAQNYTASFNSGAGCANINVSIAGANQGSFGVPSPGSTRASFPQVNNGPVKIASTNALPLLGAERVIYKVSGTNTSFMEMMGMPNSQLDTSYWLPWYNNADLDTQLRFGVP